MEPNRTNPSLRHNTKITKFFGLLEPADLKASRPDSGTVYHCVFGTHQYGGRSASGSPQLLNTLSLLNVLIGKAGGDHR